MPGHRPSTILLASVFLSVALSSAGLAQSTPPEPVPARADAAGMILECSLKGEESASYVVTAEAGQTRSVNLLASNASLSFNILAEGSQEALFNASTRAMWRMSCCRRRAGMSCRST